MRKAAREGFKGKGCREGGRKECYWKESERKWRKLLRKGGGKVKLIEERGGKEEVIEKGRGKKRLLIEEGKKGCLIQKIIFEVGRPSGVSFCFSLYNTLVFFTFFLGGF